MTDVKKVADEADMIVNGYAFTQIKRAVESLILTARIKQLYFQKMLKCWKPVWMISKYRL